jgi:DNA end-binding protein Ku
MTPPLRRSPREHCSGPRDPADQEDRYETRLRELIDAKLAGGGLVAESERVPVSSGNVIDLVAALKRSLAQSKAAEPEPEAKKPARAPAKKPAAEVVPAVQAATRAPRKRA